MMNGDHLLEIEVRLLVLVVPWEIYDNDLLPYISIFRILEYKFVIVIVFKLVHAIPSQKYEEMFRMANTGSIPIEDFVPPTTPPGFPLPNLNKPTPLNVNFQKHLLK